MKLPKGLVVALFCAIVQIVLLPASGSSLRGPDAQGFTAEQRRELQSVPAVDEVSVLRQEIKDIHKREDALKADKENLVGTLQRMMSTNATQKLENQVKALTQLKLAEESQWQDERNTLQAKIKEAADHKSDGKELLQSLQEQNLGQQKELQTLRNEMAQLKKQLSTAQFDKDGLLATLRTMVKDNAKLKKEKDEFNHKYLQARDHIQKLNVRCYNEVEKLQHGNLHRKHGKGSHHIKKGGHREKGEKHYHRKRHHHHNKAKLYKQAGQRMERLIKEKAEDAESKFQNNPDVLKATRGMDRYLERTEREDMLEQWAGPDTSPSDVLAKELAAGEQAAHPATPDQSSEGELGQWLGLSPKVMRSAEQEITAKRPAHAKAHQEKKKMPVEPPASPPMPADMESEAAANSNAEGALSPVDALDPAAVAREKKQIAEDNSDEPSDDVAKLLNQADAELNAATAAAASS